jgi:hypothetical protein
VVLEPFVEENIYASVIGTSRKQDERDTLLKIIGDENNFECQGELLHLVNFPERADLCTQPVTVEAHSCDNN